MVFVIWNDSYSVNVAEIDLQHQLLISIINDLYDAMKNKRDDDIIAEIINRLAAYAPTHFKYEEKYFEQFGYPDKDSHKKDHDSFIQTIAEYVIQFEMGEVYLSLSILNFLKNWLINHIKDIDKNYSQFFNENGLK